MIVENNTTKLTSLIKLLKRKQIMNTNASSVIMGDSSYNTAHMDAAFLLAKEALASGEVPVGCVMVSDQGSVIGRGRNTVNETRNATRHAEINAVDTVEQHAAVTGEQSCSIYPRLSVYCNVEPCIMCAAALARLWVAAVYYGCSNEKFGGCGSVGPNLLEGRVGVVKGGIRAQVSQLSPA